MHAVIKFKAINPDSNVFRFYNMRVGEDLFMSPYITTTYGRIGTRGQSRSYYYSDLKSLQKGVKGILSKRMNSSKRIGCNYIIDEESFDAEFEKTILKAQAPNQRRR